MFVAQSKSTGLSLNSLDRDFHFGPLGRPIIYNSLFQFSSLHPSSQRARGRVSAYSNAEPILIAAQKIK
jgi:hypothetical protein